jgi:hypothetical protein
LPRRIRETQEERSDVAEKEIFGGLVFPVGVNCARAS